MKTPDINPSSLAGRCERSRCRAPAVFAVDQLSWRRRVCVRHIGELLNNCLAQGLQEIPATVTRIAARDGE